MCEVSFLMPRLLSGLLCVHSLSRFHCPHLRCSLASLHRSWATHAVTGTGLASILGPSFPGFRHRRTLIPPPSPFLFLPPPSHTQRVFPKAFLGAPSSDGGAPSFEVVGSCLRDTLRNGALVLGLHASPRQSLLTVKPARPPTTKPRRAACHHNHTASQHSSGEMFHVTCCWRVYLASTLHEHYAKHE